MKLDLLGRRFELLCRTLPSRADLDEARALLRANRAWLTAAGELFCASEPGEFIRVRNGDLLYLALGLSFGYHGHMLDRALLGFPVRDPEQSPLA